MSFEKKLQSKSKKEISILVFESSKNPVLTLIEIHGGIAGSKDDVARDNKTLVEWSNTKNINYIAIDLSNNGTKPDQPSNEVLFSDRILDVETVIDFAQENYHSPLILIGSSLGGLVAINAVKYSDEVRGLILNCPAISAHKTIELMMDKKEFTDWEKNGIGTWVDIPLPYKFYTDIKELDGMKVLAKIEIPILWFHGTDDGLVPIAQAYEAKSIKHDIDLIEVNGGGHRFGNKMGPGEWEQKVESFIEDKI
jgi:pimeloyl-ACP methyl ester carboxylesterase